MVHIQPCPLLLRKAQTVQHGHHARFQSFLLAPGQSTGLVKTVLKQAINPVIKEDGQNPFPLIRRGSEKLLEGALGQHDDFAELFRLHPQNALDPFVDLPVPLDRVHGVARQFRVLVHVSVLLGTAPLFPAAHGSFDMVPASVLQKVQLDSGHGILRGVVGHHHFPGPLTAAGFPEKGIDQRVKNRGLPRAGVSRDEEDTVAQGFKIHGGFLTVGIEGFHDQLQWFHRASLPLT